MVWITKMIKNKGQFLLAVFKFSLIAFGGPSAHIAMLMKEFVEKKKFVTQKELLEYNALCQILPGPSSTQTLVAIAYQFGGLTLAILSFLIWILPSAIIMALFAIGYTHFELSNQAAKYIFVLGPMAIGFIAYSAYVLTRNVLGNRISYGLAIFAIALTLFIRNAYVFPLVLFCAILFSYFFVKVPEEKKPEDFIKTNWKKIIPLVFIFLLFAILGAIINRTSVFSLPVRLFENFYRNGVFIFGGGQVLAPLLYTEFVEMKHYLTTPEFMSGFALQQVIPGPLFSFTSFIGAMSVKGAGIAGQLLGSLAALIGINLPGLLFILTIFPFWGKLKTKKSIQSALVGINSVSVGFAIAAFFIMLQTINGNATQLLIVLLTFAMLKFTKIQPAFIICIGLLVATLFMLI